MTNSLFEIYDPYTFFMGFSLNWFTTLIIFLWSSLEYWCINSSFFKLLAHIMLKLTKEFSNFYDFVKLKTMIVLFSSLFLFLLLINILGLVPYVFACSAHFVFSVSLSFPIWLSFILFGTYKFTNKFFSHFIPVGTPLGLIVFMAIIELISMFIRPWSLSIRLMSNMIAGHLLMSLLGDCGALAFVGQFCLFMFEFFVCFIQAFVFSALLTLYSNEV